MPSLVFEIDPFQSKVGRAMATALRALQRAYSEEKAARGGEVSQAALARRIKTNRSTINRQLSGTANLTLKTMAELAAALDRDLVVDFVKPSFEDLTNDRESNSMFTGVTVKHASNTHTTKVYTEDADAVTGIKVRAA